MSTRARAKAGNGASTAAQVSVAEVVQQVGSRARAAFVCEVAASTITRWEQADAVGDPVAVLRLAALTGVPAWRIAGMPADPAGAWRQRMRLALGEAPRA